MIMMLIVCSTLSACVSCDAARVGQRSDVFQVVNERAAAGADEVLVTVSASIKTHKESSILFEPAKHGSEEYRLVVEISGQSISLPVQIIEETTGTDPQTDPESGTGLRYSYKATVRLRPGRYIVSACLPTENVTSRQEALILSGSATITVRPLYRGSAGRKPASLRWLPSFKDGVSGLNIVVN
jgi:hypothetical protein